MLNILNLYINSIFNTKRFLKTNLYNKDIKKYSKTKNYANIRP